MTKHSSLFTARQLLALATLSELVKIVQERVRRDAVAAAMADDNARIDAGGTGARAYADAIATYLSFAVSKAADYGNTICMWNSSNANVGHLFTKQAIPMSWDFVESNPLQSGLAFDEISKGIAEAFDSVSCKTKGIATQLDAGAAAGAPSASLISTDPPYYDNVPYADLSDFFYVWLRNSLGDIYPMLFSTLLVPKQQELVADPFRHGGRENAERFFEEGLGQVFARMRDLQSPDYPVTIYYAFKQAESDQDDSGGNTLLSGLASTGWETMLEGLVNTGFAITGTWPMRTERSARSRGIGSNALASSVVLVCRPRSKSAPLATRREFLSALNSDLPDALKKLQHGNIAPVDLAQAAIGPGMAVFSRYTKVIESDGSPMRVRTALQLINQALDEVLAEQESEYDADTRWALAWFEQFGINEGPYGTAETLQSQEHFGQRNGRGRSRRLARREGQAASSR